MASEDDSIEGEIIAQVARLGLNTEDLINLFEVISMLLGSSIYSTCTEEKQKANPATRLWLYDD